MSGIPEVAGRPYAARLLSHQRLQRGVQQRRQPGEQRLAAEGRKVTADPRREPEQTVGGGRTTSRGPTAAQGGATKTETEEHRDRARPARWRQHARRQQQPGETAPAHRGASYRWGCTARAQVCLQACLSPRCRAGPQGCRVQVRPRAELRQALVEGTESQRRRRLRTPPTAAGTSGAASRRRPGSAAGGGTGPGSPSPPGPPPAGRPTPVRSPAAGGRRRRAAICRRPTLDQAQGPGGRWPGVLSAGAPG